MQLKILSIVIVIGVCLLVAYLLFELLVIVEPPEAFDIPFYSTATFIAEHNATVQASLDQTQAAATVTAN